MTRLSVRGVLLVSVFAASAPVIAHSGEVALAVPRNDIKVDGDLTEWDGHPYPAPLLRQADAHEQNPTDLAATFRVAYDADSGKIFVALEVTDETHVSAPGEGADWTTQDTHLLYLDKRHRKEGSGGVLYQAGSGFREISKSRRARDPANADAGLDDIEVAIVREGNTTTYEWAVGVGDDLKAGRSLGLDHLLYDRDSAGSEEEGTLMHWGDGLSKSSNPHRLSDVVLLPPGSAVGTLKGKVRWRDEIDHPLPDRIRIESVKYPRLWVQVTVQEDGTFTATLPEGEYGVASAFNITVPFSEWFNNRPLRIDEKQRNFVTVAAGADADAGTFAIRTFARPDYLFKGEPTLAPGLKADTLELDAFVETFRRYYDVPGVSVALIRGGRVVYRRAFGVRNVITGEPVTESTLFEAASITKSMFAYAVMRLAERGLIDLDRPLHEYLAFPNISGDPRSTRMTARHVLSHRSGLPNWPWGGPGSWERGETLELLFAPGERFEYSGEAFNYLGRVLERITDKDLATIFHDEVSIPMGLATAVFSMTQRQGDFASIGHLQNRPILRPRATRVSPASSLHCTADDLAQFMLGLASGTGLTRESHVEMLSAHAAIPEDKSIYDNGRWQSSIGLGFFVQESPLGNIVGHGGNNGDFDSKFGVIPETGAGYAILTNGNAGDELIRALEIYLFYGADAELR